MEKNEIKKLLYTEKPLAHFDYIRKGVAYYQCTVNDVHVIFEIPVNDMGDADFFPTMPAQHLNRWLV